MPNLHWDKPQAALSKIPFTSLRNYLLPEKNTRQKPRQMWFKRTGSTPSWQQNLAAASLWKAQMGSEIFPHGSNSSWGQVKGGGFSAWRDPERSLCKIVETKPELQWSPEDVGDARALQYLLRRPVQGKQNWTKREKHVIASNTWRTKSSKPFDTRHGAAWSCRASVFLWSGISSLCLHSLFLVC